MAAPAEGKKGEKRRGERFADFWLNEEKKGGIFGNKTRTGRAKKRGVPFSPCRLRHGKGKGWKVERRPLQKKKGGWVQSSGLLAYGEGGKMVTIDN